MAGTDQVRRFSDDSECHGEVEDWQVRQAEQALRLYLFGDVTV